MSILDYLKKKFFDIGAESSQGSGTSISCPSSHKIRQSWSKSKIRTKVPISKKLLKKCNAANLPCCCGELNIRGRALHYVIKIDNRSETIRFYRDILGMTVLRHQEFSDLECKRNDGKSVLSKTIFGYGPEDYYFAFELVYHYNERCYLKGNEFVGVTIRSSECLIRATKQRWPIHAGNVLIAPGGFKFFIVDKPQSKKRDPIVKITFACSDINKSELFWVHLLGLNKELARDKTMEVSFKADEVKLELRQMPQMVNRAECIDRIVYSCPIQQLKQIEERFHKQCGGLVVLPVTSVETAGNLPLQTLVLADPDGHEVCFVDDLAFRCLSQYCPDSEDTLTSKITAEKNPGKIQSDRQSITSKKSTASGRSNTCMSRRRSVISRRKYSEDPNSPNDTNLNCFVESSVSVAYAIVEELQENIGEYTSNDRLQAIPEGVATIVKCDDQDNYNQGDEIINKWECNEFGTQSGEVVDIIECNRPGCDYRRGEMTKDRRNSEESSKRRGSNQIAPDRNKEDVLNTSRCNNGIGNQRDELADIIECNRPGCDYRRGDIERERRNSDESCKSRRCKQIPPDVYREEILNGCNQREELDDRIECSRPGCDYRRGIFGKDRRNSEESGKRRGSKQIEPDIHKEEIWNGCNGGIDNQREELGERIECSRPGCDYKRGEIGKNRRNSEESGKKRGSKQSASAIHQKEILTTVGCTDEISSQWEDVVDRLECKKPGCEYRRGDIAKERRNSEEIGKITESKQTIAQHRDGIIKTVGCKDESDDQIEDVLDGIECNKPRCKYRSGEITKQQRNSQVGNACELIESSIETCNEEILEKNKSDLETLPLVSEPSSTETLSCKKCSKIQNTDTVVEFLSTRATHPVSMSTYRPKVKTRKISRKNKKGSKGSTPNGDTPPTSEYYLQMNSQPISITDIVNRTIMKIANAGGLPLIASKSESEQTDFDSLSDTSSSQTETTPIPKCINDAPEMTKTETVILSKTTFNSDKSNKTLSQIVKERIQKVKHSMMKSPRVGEYDDTYVGKFKNDDNEIRRLFARPAEAESIRSVDIEDLFSACNVACQNEYPIDPSISRIASHVTIPNDDQTDDTTEKITSELDNNLINKNWKPKIEDRLNRLSGEVINEFMKFSPSYNISPTRSQQSKPPSRDISPVSRNERLIKQTTFDDYDSPSTSWYFDQLTQSRRPSTTHPYNNQQASAMTTEENTFDEELSITCSSTSEPASQSSSNCALEALKDMSQKISGTGLEKRITEEVLNMMEAQPQNTSMFKTQEIAKKVADLTAENVNNILRKQAMISNQSFKKLTSQSCFPTKFSRREADIQTVNRNILLESTLKTDDSAVDTITQNVKNILQQQAQDSSRLEDNFQSTVDEAIKQYVEHRVHNLLNVQPATADPISPMMSTNEQFYKQVCQYINKHLEDDRRESEQMASQNIEDDSYSLLSEEGDKDEEIPEYFKQFSIPEERYSTNTTVQQPSTSGDTSPLLYEHIRKRAVDYIDFKAVYEQLKGHSPDTNFTAIPNTKFEQETTAQTMADFIRNKNSKLYVSRVTTTPCDAATLSDDRQERHDWRNHGKEFKYVNHQRSPIKIQRNINANYPSVIGNSNMLKKKDSDERRNLFSTTLNHTQRRPSLTNYLHRDDPERLQTPKDVGSSAIHRSYIEDPVKQAGRTAGQIPILQQRLMHRIENSFSRIPPINELKVTSTRVSDVIYSDITHNANLHSGQPLRKYENVYQKKSQLEATTFPVKKTNWKQVQGYRENINITSGQMAKTIPDNIEEPVRKRLQKIEELKNKSLKRKHDQSCASGSGSIIPAEHTYKLPQILKTAVYPGEEEDTVLQKKPQSSSLSVTPVEDKQKNIYKTTIYKRDVSGIPVKEPDIVSSTIGGKSISKETTASHDEESHKKSNQEDSPLNDGKHIHKTSSESIKICSKNSTENFTEKCVTVTENTGSSSDMEDAPQISGPKSAKRRHKAKSNKGSVSPQKYQESVKHIEDIVRSSRVKDMRRTRSRRLDEQIKPLPVIEENVTEDESVSESRSKSPKKDNTTQNKPNAEEVEGKSVSDGGSKCSKKDAHKAALKELKKKLHAKKEKSARLAAGMDERIMQPLQSIEKIMDRLSEVQAHLREASRKEGPT